jgi:4-methoxybenzoate monooxygenase (O-demethylating)
MPTFPVSSLDPFADDFLAAPYPFYAELREAGPVVWLERYGLWACACHAEVQATLSDWQTFSSAAGVGIDDFRRTKPWRPPSLILEADPPLHTRSRTVMNRALSAKPMAGLRAGFKEAAEKLADELIARRWVDATADIAEAYPLSVFPKAVGLGREGVENLLPYGAMVFNAFGPRNAHFEAVMAASDDDERAAAKDTTGDFELRDLFRCYRISKQDRRLDVVQMPEPLTSSSNLDRAKV